MAASAEVPIRLSVNISLLIAGDFFWNYLLQIWNYKEILILCMETPQAKSTLYLPTTCQSMALRICANTKLAIYFYKA